jgi:branched-chain amino acid transport system permease protein
MEKFIQLVVSGLAIGSIYGLTAMGFVLVFKATDVFNFAHGEFMMLGAVLALVFAESMGISFPLAMLLVLLLVGVMGLVMQVTVVRPMLGQPLLSVVMATMGLSLIIRAITEIQFGPLERNFPTPFPNEVIKVGDIIISSLQLVIIGVAVVCVLVFALYFRRSKMGLQMRATAEHFEAAVLSGVNANRTFGTALALGSMLAAIGGVLIAQLNVVSTRLGDVGLTAALPAIVIGGMQSIPGSVIGGLIVGVLEKLATGYFGAGSANLVVYGVLLLMLMIRPYGLFGEKEIIRV